MADKNWAVNYRIAIACAVASTVAFSFSAIASETLADSPAATADPNAIWQILIGGFVIFSFASAVILWIMATFRNLRRSYSRGTAFVHNALNHLSDGIAMVDSGGRVVFCNDRYLDIYGIDRDDIVKGMSAARLIELQGRSGARLVQSGDADVYELPNGRAITVKNRGFAAGGMVSLHEDCTDRRQLAQQLAMTKAFLEQVVDNVPVCVAAKNIDDGRYILANRAFEEFSRFPRDHIIGKRAEEIFTPRTAAAIEAADRSAIESTDGSISTELKVDRKGDKRVLATSRVVARDQAGEPLFLIAVFEDVTDRKSLSDQLVESKRFLETIIDNIPIALIVKQINNGRYLLANRRSEDILRRSREEAIGRSAVDIYETAEAAMVLRRDTDAVRRGGLHAEEYPIDTRDGLRLFLTRQATVSDDAGRPQYLIKTHEDITERRKNESLMAHMAYHDPLTGIPNRAAFLKTLAQMIDACATGENAFSVLSVDLDGLKEINDVLGHAAGDAVLIEVARRMQEIANKAAIARLSGDEFGIIVDGRPEDAVALAQQMGATMATEINIDGRTTRAGITIGISNFPRDGADAATILTNSGVALFRAKAKSRGSIGVFEPEMDQQIRDRRALHQDLACAVRNGEMSLHYQPQAKATGSIGSGDIRGFEALARWRHPTRGTVPPGEFIPLAEESGLIVELGEWILREACREAASWENPLQIAVNLSPAQFAHGDLVSLVHMILLETGLSPGRLEIEITEGVLIEDFERALNLLRRLKALGVRVAMDDFGSGYSSLTYLQAFPFDKIKIDRTFVINLGRSPQSAAIVRAVIGLSHGLGIQIVAEGVETEEQLRFLSDEGCDIVQGYLIGRPAPIQTFPHLVGGEATAAELARLTG